ncbi:MAG TPA: hypothetical protein VIP46_03960 [Pyrinomonadaceae bacterium]
MRRRLSLICAVSLLLFFVTFGTAEVNLFRRSTAARAAALQAQSYGEEVWVDDGLPAGNVVAAGDGGDAWNWTNGNVRSGASAHASNAVTTQVVHQHYFYYSVPSDSSMTVAAGDTLFAYVYLNPANMPTQVMLQWRDTSGTWEHRAYWGADRLEWGLNGQPSRLPMGGVPLGGRWARLEVPAALVGMEGQKVTGMAFTLVGGQATWDRAGRVTPPPPSAETVWVEDSLPDANAPVGADGGDSWNWVSDNRWSGASAHRSNAVTTQVVHQHLFYNAFNRPLHVAAGDALFAYVYLNPANMPSQVMLQWHEPTAGWNHRAYWGADRLEWGLNGTASRLYMGPVPRSGGWVRLEVPAADVGLQGAVDGMAFTLVGGQATWDRAGKFSQFAPTPTPAPTPSGPVVMTVLADDPAAKHQNFKLQTTGFSVVKAPDAYHVYGSTNLQQIRWRESKTWWDNLYHDTAVYPFGTNRPDCSFSKDPRLWESICSTDALGYFWKSVGCRPGAACRDNDWWNAGGGEANIDTYATNLDENYTANLVTPVWPQLYNSAAPYALSSYGTPGFRTMIDHDKVNAVNIQPGGDNCHDAETIWLDDAIPAGPAPSDPALKVEVGGNEGWKWVAASPAPTPYSSTAAAPALSAGAPFSPPPFPSMASHQSESMAGMHQHFFRKSSAPLKIDAGDVLIAYVYLHPAEMPTEVMLQWHEPTAGWNHRAYWGADKITAWSPRTFIGAIPNGGGWVRLEVPADRVGLVGKNVDGIAFTLFDGRATWDRAGKTRPLPDRPCPPKSRTNPADSAHAYNPDDYATGASNSKVVQVNYAGGETRWFMAFNKMIKRVNGSYHVGNGQDVYNVYNESLYGRSAADNWEVMWATSADGKDWTIHPQMLFRSVSQAVGSHMGLLVTDMMIDGGYFYILVTDLSKVNSYLVRARIDPTHSATSAGYVQNAGEGWSVASHPLTAAGEYTWRRLPLGAQVDFDDLTQAPGCRQAGACVTAYPVMQADCSSWGCWFPFQSSMARINSTTTGQSRLFGVSADWDYAAGEARRVKLWSTPSLSKPFVYESDVSFPQWFRIGAFGWEFGFNHYPDNTAQTPRILSSGFDVWYTVNEHPLDKSLPPKVPVDRYIVLERHTARLSNF